MINKIATKEIHHNPVFTLAVFVVVLIIAQPFLWGMIKSQVKTLHSNRTLKEQIKQVDNKNSKIRNKYNTEKTHLAKLSLSAPKDKSSIQIIEKIEKKAKERDMSVEISRIDEGMAVSSSNLKPKVENIEKEKTNTKKGSVFPLYITLSVSGRPQSLLSYMDDIEHMQEIAEIQKVSIFPHQSKTKIKSRANLFEALITVIFYQQEKDAVEKK